MDRQSAMKQTGETVVKLFTAGLPPLWVQPLKDADYELANYQELPPPEVVNDQALLVTSEVVPASRLRELADDYPYNRLIYYYLTPGISGFEAVALACRQLGITFLRPQIAIPSMLDMLGALFQRLKTPVHGVVGVFGVTPGIGVTSVAALVAQSLRKPAVMLGLNLFNPGWKADSDVKLDNWRSRLSARLLSQLDIQSLIAMDRFKYLPGNSDPILAMDYTEDEVAHLIDTARQQHMVVCDCGAIPHSAAWVHAVQHCSLRIMVGHADYRLQLERLMRLSQDLGIGAEHWCLLLNKSDTDMPAREIADRIGMQVFGIESLPLYKEKTSPFFLPLTKKEQERLSQTTLLLEGGDRDI